MFLKFEVIREFVSSNSENSSKSVVNQFVNIFNMLFYLLLGSKENNLIKKITLNEKEGKKFRSLKSPDNAPSVKPRTLLV